MEEEAVKLNGFNILVLNEFAATARSAEYCINAIV